MVLPKLSKTTTGSHTPLIFNQTVVQTTLDALLLIQDGGKCSDSKITTLSMKEAK
jgi:hypothetical protein